jgi:hypothetical protein
MNSSQPMSRSDSPDFRWLFYVVDWLPPDFGAVGQYGMIYARDYAQNGRKVILVGLTSGRADMQKESFPGGGSLEIRRLAARRYDKSRYVRRLLWTVQTNARLIWNVIRDPRSRDADFVFTGAPPFILYFAVVAKLLRGFHLTYRINDFYPEVLIAQIGRRSLPLQLLERFTWWLRRHVDTFQVLGEDQRRLLIKNGIAPERIRLVRDKPPFAFTAEVSPATTPVELVDRKVLLYSGNFGVAHEVDTVVEGLIQHHRTGSGRFGLWLNASGANADVVEMRLRTAGVPVARTAPVPLEELPAVLAAADAHLITLRPQFSGLVLPSKIYGCIASRRAIVFIGPTSSDVHLLCTGETGLAYAHVEPGDAPAFTAALERLADMNSTR